MDPAFLSIDMFGILLHNVAILALLILFYNLIPDEIRNGRKSIFSLAVGLIFGFAAFTTIVLLYETGGQIVGINIILVPLAGFIGGIFSAIIVASILIGGSVAGTGSLSGIDMMTIAGGLLIGIIFNATRTWKGFPRSYFTQLLLLGVAVLGLEILATILLPGRTIYAATGPLYGLGGMTSAAPLYGPVPGPEFLSAGPGVISLVPLLIVTILGIILLGTIIMLIDQRKDAEKELLRHKEQLEEMVDERTLELKKVNSLQKATIESTEDAIVVTDLKGTIRAYNRKASAILRIVSVPKEGEEGISLSDLTTSRLQEGSRIPPPVSALPHSAEQVIASDLVFRNGRIYELYVHPQQIGTEIIGRVWNFHDITEQRNAEDALKAVNNKLILLSNITRHDILNQLTALFGYYDLAKATTRDPEVSNFLDNMKKTMDIIRLQIEFTRDYQDLGLNKPAWQDLRTAFLNAAADIRGPDLNVLCDIGRIEVYADPLIERVFYNMIDNSLRHGEHVTAIRLLSVREGTDLVILYEDNGTGVTPEEKDKIFLKGHGKHTGLGLFLIREILSITGITIKETGKFGEGVRFEIRVPAGKFRIN